MGAAFEDLQAVKSGSTTGSHVRHHTTDDAAGDASRRSLVNLTTSGVGVRLLSKEIMVFHDVAVEGTRNVQLLNADQHLINAIKKISP
jgi:hypothetical protein